MPGVHLMRIEAPGIACSVKPGQFITLQCGDLILRRPLSVHYVASPEIALLFRVAGKGTLWLSQRQPGDRVDILGPLGNGFNLPPGDSEQSQHLLLVAGGMGIAPLVFLTQYAASLHAITLVHGVSTAGQLYPWAVGEKGSSAVAAGQRRLPTLPEGVRFVAVTEDGTMGQTGMATGILPDLLDGTDQVYACGPLSMYEAMAGVTYHSESRCSRDQESRGTREGLVSPHNLKLKRCQVSLEVRLGCGFGACYGCTIKTKKGLKRVCRDGPVFELDDIIWQEVRL